MTRSDPVRCGKWPGLAPTDPGCAYNDALRCESASRDMSALITTAGLQMTDGKRPFKETLALQIVRLKIQQIFEECSKFDESDKKALYEVIGNLLLQRIRSAETPTTADEAPPELTELTDAAPTDDFTSSSKVSDLPLVDVNAAFPK